MSSQQANTIPSLNGRIPALVFKHIFKEQAEHDPGDRWFTVSTEIQSWTEKEPLCQAGQRCHQAGENRHTGV